MGCLNNLNNILKSEVRFELVVPVRALLVEKKQNFLC